MCCKSSSAKLDASNVSGRSSGTNLDASNCVEKVVVPTCNAEVPNWMLQTCFEKVASSSAKCVAKVRNQMGCFKLRWESSGSKLVVSWHLGGTNLDASKLCGKIASTLPWESSGTKLVVWKLCCKNSGTKLDASNLCWKSSSAKCVAKVAVPN